MALSQRILSVQGHVHTILCMVLLGLVAAARATKVASFSIIHPYGSDTASFQISFDQTPDFLTIDPYGRPADLFQIYVFTEVQPPPVGLVFWSSIPWRWILRSNEIHLASDIFLRNPCLLFEEEPAAQGWGSLRGQVPYSLNDTLLSFEAPLDLLGAGGTFGDVLENVEYGAMNA